MRTDPSLADADGFYAAMIAANEDLSDAESEAFLLRLTLLLANQIGDRHVLIACIDAARRDLIEMQNLYRGLGLWTYRERADGERPFFLIRSSMCVADDGDAATIFFLTLDEY